MFVLIITMTAEQKKRLLKAKVEQQVYRLRTVELAVLSPYLRVPRESLVAALWLAGKIENCT